MQVHAQPELLNIPESSGQMILGLLCPSTDVAGAPKYTGNAPVQRTASCAQCTADCGAGGGGGAGEACRGLPAWKVE